MKIAIAKLIDFRLECELPETQDRFQDNASMWSDANAAIPSIEERLNSLERGMGEMIHLMRQMVHQSSTAGGSPHSHAGRSVDETAPGDSSPIPSFTLRPVQLIRDLQIECFSGRDNFSSDVDLLGDAVSQGIIDVKLSLKLIELWVFCDSKRRLLTDDFRFVEYFSPWVSIDLSSSIQRTDTLLFNTACLLASRYLPGMPSNTIHDISIQVQHGVTKALWRKSPLSNDLLQALALLCLYPTSGHKEGFMDGWLLSGISINHALISFSFLNQPPSKSLLSDEMLSQMRLWNTFCLTHLQYVHHFNIKILANNVPVLPSATDVLSTCSPSTWTTAPGSWITLEQLQRTEESWQRSNSTESPSSSKTAPSASASPKQSTKRSNAGKWNGPISSVGTSPRSNQTTQELTSNPAHEGQSTLELSIWFCQLLLHRTATNLQADTDRLSHEICSNARLIITRSLQTRFSAAPGLIDNVYYILGYAALTLCDYTPQDQLIDQVRAFLLHLAPSSDHIAYRIAFIVGEMQRRYNEAATATATTNTDQSSPATDVLKNTIFGPPPQPPRTENLDLSQLMPAGGSMDGLVDSYACFEQLIPAGYVAPQPAFSAPGMFQQHPAPVGGALPVSLVPRAMHDF